MQTLSVEFRVLFWAILGVIVPFGLLLFLFPGGTGSYWAWVVPHPRSAILIGAAYVGATPYYLLAPRGDGRPCFHLPRSRAPRARVRNLVDWCMALAHRAAGGTRIPRSGSHHRVDRGDGCSGGAPPGPPPAGGGCFV